jgi:beta-glucosidase
LSYSTFKYTNLQVSPAKIDPNGKIRVSVDVENTGPLKGDEVVQLYLHDPVASVARPVKELKGFSRITLEPNEKKSVTFALSREELGFLDATMKFVVEPGTIEVLVGSSSDDIRAKSVVEVVK